MRIFALALAAICAASTPFVLFPRQTSAWITPEQLIAALLFWPVIVISILLLIYGLSRISQWRQQPSYTVIFVLALIFPGTIAATTVIGKIGKEIYLAEQARREQWFKYGKILNPLIIEYIQKYPERITFPFDDDRASIDGLGDYLKSQTILPIKGNDIIDPWGDPVLVIVDHDKNMEMKFEDQFYGAYNSKGNKIAVSLFASVPHSLDRTYSERWQIADGVIPNQ